MYKKQWKKSLDSSTFKGLTLPFDKPISSHSCYNLVHLDNHIKINTLDAKPEVALSALLLLLNSYQANTDITLSIKIFDSEIKPFLHANNPKRLNDFFIIALDILEEYKNPDHLTTQEAAKLFAKELSNLDIPINQCCFHLQKQSNNKPVDSYLYFYLQNNNLGVYFDDSLFNPSTADRILSSWGYIVKQILSAAPSTEVPDIETISPQEKETQLQTWNSNNTPLPKLQSVNQAFELMVDTQPEKKAVSDTSLSYSYRELENESNHIANSLIDTGTHSSDIIGVALPRNVHLLSTTIGIFKSGAAYLPLDPDFPDDRLQYMVEHSQSKVLVTSDDLKDRFKYFKGKVITIESLLTSDDKNTNRPSTLQTTDDSAYVIYTSGSTGLPKGVEISHGNVINLLASMAKKPGMDCNDTLCAITTLSFDISVVELFLPLYAGAHVLIIGKNFSLFPDKLIKVLEDYSVSILQATPATFRLLMSEDWNPTNKIKILCGGEPFPRDLARDLLARVGSVWNVYGPTETTVWSTVFEINDHTKPILIGKPIDNTTTYIFDDNMQLAPIGISGNLYIGGLGLAKGYLHREELTNERFISHPITKERIYDTGDIAKYTYNGDIECLGRNDGQVKIRGYRIELGEIEEQISHITDIKSQVVIVREDTPGNQRLVAYYQTESGNELPFTSFKEALSQSLPAYMIPASYVHMQSFPMTLNYKIDRKALPEPNIKIFNNTISTPATPTEHFIHSIWTRLLGLTEIDTQKNYFDIGGNSLLSVQLFGKIKSKFNLNLPLDTLFNYGDIHTLSKRIDELVENSDSKIENSLPNVIPIQKKGTGNPIFFFHGVGGNVLNYQRLVDALNVNRPAYGFQSSGVDGHTALAKTYQEMLDTYLEQLRSIQSHGPYTLAGGSMGGSTAIDIANLLEESGEKVERLIMFDTFGPDFDSNKFGEALHSVSFMQRVKNTFTLRVLMLKIKLHSTLNKLFNVDLPHSVRYQIIENNNYKLLSMRKATEYPGDIISIRAPKQTSGIYADPEMGWGRSIKGKIQIYYVEGNHFNIVESKETIKILKSLLLKAEKKASSMYKSITLLIAHEWTLSNFQILQLL